MANLNIYDLTGALIDSLIIGSGMKNQDIVNNIIALNLNPLRYTWTIERINF